MGIAEVAGARIAWWADGEGARTLVLVHAGVADARMWQPLVARLAGEYRVVRYDMRRFGRSRAPADEPFLAAADLDALLAQLNVEAAHVVGASFGGQVALELAATAPARVASLVLLAPAMPDHEPSPAIAAYDEEETALYEAGRLDDVVELNVRTWVDGPARTPQQSDPEIRALVATMQREALDLQEAEGWGMEELDPPVSERLDAIGVPVTIAAGELDVPDFAAIAERLVADLPDARMERIAGAGHLIALERPQETARLVARHLDRVSPPASPPR